uniref:Uncharacterized protein n=1 Tax=Anguilla anguilla TaxID=7936 RepID=A0A0E9R8X9_ANGAN
MKKRLQQMSFYKKKKIRKSAC